MNLHNALVSSSRLGVRIFFEPYKESNNLIVKAQSKDYRIIRTSIISSDDPQLLVDTIIELTKKIKEYK